VSQKGSRSLLGKRKNLFLAGKRSLKTGEPDRNVNKNIGPQKSPKNSPSSSSLRGESTSSLKHSSLKEDWVSSDPVGKLSAGEKFLKN